MESGPESRQDLSATTVRIHLDSSWMEYQPKPIKMTSKLTKIRMMTFNVWFDDFALRQRAVELCRLIKEVSPDVICLQEVTLPFLNMLKMASCFREGAVISDIEGSTLNGYGVVIISNNPDLIPERFTICRFPSMMGRKLLAAYFNVQGKRVAVGCVHLESLDSAKIRQTQLKISNEELSSSSDSSFLMGDFNFDDKRNFHIDVTPLENDMMRETLKGWIDTWEHLKPTEDGKTFDSVENKMLTPWHKHERMRYDRIMFHSEDWAAQHIDLAGVEPFTQLPGRDGKVLPVVVSDHFGLVAEYSVKSPIPSDSGGKCQLDQVKSESSSSSSCALM
eukprot:TRINITY_DN10835_c0_g1_i1.p1 TRINITY_DN10835_c0_g1~~TRINITY_DN10835_c0_g1_i1.p1  ORF type:complete len:344 (-),score=44.48 TRINITY_DN10835_c0_g1_i1:13-1014(-)